MKRHYKGVIKRYRNIIASVIVGGLTLLIVIGIGAHTPTRAQTEWELAVCDKYCRNISYPPTNVDCEAAEHPQD